MFLEILPEALRNEIAGVCELAQLGEVHLRAERQSSVTVNGECRRLKFRCDKALLQELLVRCCGGSLYAYRDSIRAGYVALSGGVRVGIAGRAVTEGAAVVAVSDMTSLCFRIPHAVAGVAAEAYELWVADGGRRGVLVLAPPACGKTTFLRDFLIFASSGACARRVAVIDSREELCPQREGEFADVLRGYPRAAGLEIALRTLSPEALVCDEIGAEEVMTIGELMHSGVPLIASMHGSSLMEIKRRTGVRALLESGLFGYVVTLGRSGGMFTREITELPC